MNKEIFTLKNLYIALFILTVAVIVFHPWLIEKKLTMISEEKEEIIEIILTLVLLALGYVMLTLYEREVKKKHTQMVKCNYQVTGLAKKLEDAFKYIGRLNVQISEIRSVFSGVKKYPKSKSDLRYSMKFTADKILGMVNAGWVALKVIESNSLATLTEISVSRSQGEEAARNISNKELVSEKIPGSTTISSEQNNLYLKAYCVLPALELTREQKVFIKAAVSQLEFMYIIFSSNYYRDSE